MILQISSVSVVMSPFSFLIFFIWILSFCLLVHLAKGLSILLTFSKNQLLVLLILCIVFLVFYWLLLALVLIIPCLLLLFRVLASFFFSRVFRCTFKLLVWELSKCFMEALSAMNFPLSPVLIVSHKFEYVVFIFIEF